MDSKNSEFTDEEKQLIQDQFQDLLQSARMSQSPEDKAIITKAFDLANRAHANMRRKSGEPYILHPIAVAKIATTEIGLGTKSIAAALLHDVVEDTDFTVEDIKMQFGDKIANIEILESMETPGICDPAFEAVPKAILESQSTQVDSVAGATQSSAAIMAAVEDALSQIKK